MYENLIGIYFRKFWEPESFRERVIRWLVILISILLSIYIFLLKLDNIHAYETACRNQVTVEALKTPVPVNSFFSASTTYDIYVSFEFEGVTYSDVYYRHTKNPAVLWDPEKTVPVAVNPQQPEILIRNMLLRSPLDLSFGLWVFGFSLLIYVLALASPRFFAWRVRSANKISHIFWTGRQPCPRESSPIYIMDLALVMIPVHITTICILSQIFPYTF